MIDTEADQQLSDQQYASAVVVEYCNWRRVPCWPSMYAAAIRALAADAGIEIHGEGTRAEWQRIRAVIADRRAAGQSVSRA